MSEIEKEARRRYMRQYMRGYRKYNKDRIKEIQTRYWEKKFKVMEKEQDN
jgi:hypothetical protein